LAVTGALLTLLLFPLAGCIAGRRPFSEAYLLGVGVIGATMFVAGVMHVPLAVTFVIVVVISAVQLIRDRHRVVVDAPQFSRWQTALMIAPLLALAFVASITPLNDFDGRVFWVLKAKALVHDGSINGPFFQNREVSSPRNQYPLLIPLDAAAIMTLARDTDDHQIRFLYLGIFAALAFHARRRLARFVDPQAAAWTATILVWIPQFAIATAGGALTAYNDIAIAAFLACAFFELMEDGDAAMFGVWLAFVVLTKSEGLPLAAILVVLGALRFRRRIAVSLAPLAIATTALLAWRSGIPRTDEEAFLERLPLLPQRLDRILPALGGIVRFALALDVWGVFWIAALAGVALLAARREWRPAALIVAIGALYTAVYMVTVWVLDDLLRASADRLLMHVIGPALFGVAEVVGRVNRAFARSR
jgi:hypothetical protein